MILPLTDRGKKQARAAGRKLKNEGVTFDLIVASPMSRAHQTALIVARELDYPAEQVQLLDILIERDNGTLAGTSGISTVERSFTRINIEDMPGVEKIADVQTRAERALQSIHEMGATSVLVISHGTFGRALRRVIDQEPPEFEFDPQKHWRLDNGEVVRFI